MWAKETTNIDQTIHYINEASRFIELPKFGFCAVCGFPLTVLYPEDYPDEWKFCCSCLRWAELIAKDDPIVKFMRINSSSILREINNRITLVKGNDGKK